MSIFVLVPIFVMLLGAALLTLLLVVALLGGLAGGVVCYRIAALRAAAPFVLLVPTLTALGAGAGSWGLFLLLGERYQAWAWPLWAVGYPAGGVAGFLAGLALAILMRRRSRAGRARMAIWRRQ